MYTHPLNGHGHTYTLPAGGTVCPECEETPSAFQEEGPTTWCPLCGAEWTE
jgi:hypothetical protein